MRMRRIDVATYYTALRYKGRKMTSNAIMDYLLRERHQT
jgi:hypothetical protein